MRHYFSTVALQFLDSDFGKRYEEISEILIVDR